MTWKEFKRFVECEGVTDDMEIDYMDFTDFDCDSGKLIIDINRTIFSIY